jgi:hypothetical protein
VTATEGTAARSIEPVLEPIDVYLEDTILSGAIDSRGERVTELLNAAPLVRVRLRDGGAWASVDREEILLVAPPPHAGHGQRRLHRVKRRIEAKLGRYVVEGTAHLPPGARVDWSVVQRHRGFLPVTNALVWWDGEDERHLSAAILNTRRIDAIRDLLAGV